jgi:hypothetical protein
MSLDREAIDLAPLDSLRAIRCGFGHSPENPWLFEEV